MKKMIPLLLCLSMLLTVCAVTVPTAALNDSVNDSTWSEIELKALVYQEGKSFYSALAKGYENYDSGWKEIRELDGEEREICSINMRGFCVTPDGKYALMGHLNGSNFRGCALYDFASGAITDVYYRFDSEQDPSVAQGPFSYVKGIAADDRGNVYCGSPPTSTWSPWASRTSTMRPSSLRSCGKVPCTSSAISPAMRTAFRSASTVWRSPRSVTSTTATS
jgi:hypothetical protein